MTTSIFRNSALKPPTRRSLAGAWLGLCLFGLAGCSAPQLGYNKLDWLASWELRKYVKLSPAQKPAYNQAFDSLWQWHRQQELPIYVRDMRALAAQMLKPLSQAQVNAWMQRFDAHWNRLAAQMAPSVCRQMAGFSDRQVASVLDRIDADIDDRTEEFITPSEAKVRRDAEQRLLKKLRRWAGHLDDYQRSLVREWSQSRPLDYAAWIDQKRRWRDAFANALSQRQSETFCPQLKTLFLRQDEAAGMGLHTRNDSRRLEWSAFLAQMTATMSTAQREHMQNRLLDMASDFEALTRQ